MIAYYATPPTACADCGTSDATLTAGIYTDEGRCADCLGPRRTETPCHDCGHYLRNYACNRCLAELGQKALTPDEMPGPLSRLGDVARLLADEADYAASHLDTDKNALALRYAVAELLATLNDDDVAPLVKWPWPNPQG